TPKPPETGTLSGMAPSQVMSSAPPMETVQALLCWSEHYQGKWLPARMSDSNAPFSFSISGKYRLSGSRVFDRNRLEFSVRETKDGALWLTVRDTGYIKTLGKSSKPNRLSMVLFNTHSGPVQAPADLKVAPAKSHYRRTFMD